MNTCVHGLPEHALVHMSVFYVKICRAVSHKSANSGGTLQSKHLCNLVIKLFLMLNSAEHEIFTANEYENASNSWHFHILAGKVSCLLAEKVSCLLAEKVSCLLAEKVSCLFMCIKKEFVIVSNVWFISRSKFIFSWVKHKKRFITSGSRHSIFVIVSKRPACAQPRLSSRASIIETFLLLMIINADVKLTTFFFFFFLQCNIRAVN